MFYRHQNLGIRKFQAGSGKLDTEKIELVADAIRNEDGPVDTGTIVEKTDLSERKVVSALHRLEDVGAVESLATGEVVLAPETDLDQAVQAAAEENELHKEQKRQRLEQMQTYAETSQCRRELLLRYFGDEFEAPCGNCDNCERPAETSVGTRREVSV